MTLQKTLRAVSPTSWLWLAALALVLAGLILLPVDAHERNLVARLGGVLAAAAMLLFVRRLPSDVRPIWLLFWLYQSSVVIGDVIYNYQQLTMGEIPFPGLADALYMLSYVFALAGLVMLTRLVCPRRSLDVAAESFVIGLALLALVSYFIIVPLVDAAETWDLGLVISVAYPVLDVFVLAALVRLYLLSPAHNAALFTLSAAMLIFLLLDLGYYYYLGVVGTELDIEIPWMVALAMMTAAAGMPSARRVAVQNLQDQDIISGWRAVIVAASVLVPLVLVIVDHLRAYEGRDLWFLSLAIAVVALVLWRAYRLLGMARRQHMELSQLAQAEADARREAVAARQAAESASMAKSQFLSVMSHELRTPLTATMGMFELIQKSAPADHVHDLAARGLKSSEHLLALVNEILDLSTIEAGRLRVVTAPFGLKELLVEATHLAKISGAQGVTFDTRIDDGLEERKLLGDVMRLKQVLINLLGNALKFTQRGCVAFSVRKVGGTSETPLLEFAVSDTGIGMTPEQLSRLFQPFTQLDMGNTRRFGGAGLGLAISQRLVKLMGGEPIKVESLLGAGSRFSFRIAMPVADGAPALQRLPAGTHLAHQEGRLSGYKLLLVEDDDDSRFVMRLALESEGATVDEAEDGSEAVRAALAATTPYDAVLMDMRMPGKDGLASTRELRAKDYRHTIIALTANAFAADREACLAAGMNDFATKPLDMDKLVDVMKRHRRGSD